MNRTGGGERPRIFFSIDELISCIKDGYVVLIEGEPGTGKTTLAASICYSYVKRGMKCLYISSTELERDFIARMKKLGMDFEKFRDRFTYFHMLEIQDEDCSRVVAREIVAKVLKEGIKCVVFDTFNTLFAPFEGESGKSRTMLQLLALHTLKVHGVTSVFVSEGTPRQGFKYENFLCDAVFRLYTVERGGIVHRILEVAKLRDEPIRILRYMFAIVQGKGIVLHVPLKERLRGSFNLKDRLPTGVKGLDKILGGGIPRGYILLISGPSGTCKTLISATISIACARRGERVLYVSFEESEEQVKNILKSLGYDMESDNIFVMSINPSSATLPEICYAIYTSIRERKPTLLVFDGVSALERVFGSKDSLSMLRDILSYVKSHGITTVLTLLKNISAGECTELSTLSDGIIATWFERHNGSIHRMLAIYKARGIDHDNRIFRLEVRNGEVELRGP